MSASELLLGEGSWDDWHMSCLPATLTEDVIDQPAWVQFEVFLDEHRGAVNRCTDLARAVA